ncbi:hypothetical protein [Paenibacillus sp. FSL E2-0151]|uniref:hypothetical protein n=1 Tax=Paenibacillus sp. FSL E2-0151 TaxID=2921357 RepID=UPI0030EC9433
MNYSETLHIYENSPANYLLVKLPKQRRCSSAYNPEKVAHADPDHIPGSRTAGGADG